MPDRDEAAERRSEPSGGSSPVDTPCQPIGTPEPHAARPDRSSVQPGRTATPQRAPEPGRIAVRLNPSREHSIESSREPSTEHPRAKTSGDAAARLLAWQGNQAVEVIQNRIAQRLGPDGWLILSELSEADLNRLTILERRRKLDDETLRHAILEHLALRERRGAGG
jgi:hypothetical protein